MHPYPHHYKAGTSGGPAAAVTVNSPGLPSLASAPPPEFDGPGGVWSPETLLCAALADCFVLTFRGISRASKFEWLSLDCTVEGTLERVDGVARFTRYATHATLSVAPGSDRDKARLLLEKAEHSCLIANSVTGQRELYSEVIEA